jgi:phosphatidylglycerol:prolipoprotein diacylglycerol transferase
MSPVLLHIWGPLAIHAYGLCIAIGVSITIWLLWRDQKLQKLISADDASVSLQIIIACCYLGGRITCLLTEPEIDFNLMSIIKFWEPGLSILGGILGAILGLCLFLYLKKIPMLPYMDRLAIYAPLVQAFGRVGCFFAGCCFGTCCNAWWAVTYRHPEHMAPLNIALHPSQLYSAVVLLTIFLYLYCYAQHHFKRPGMLLCNFLILVSLERFIVDFWRWDRSWWQYPHVLTFLSVNQWIAVGIIMSSIVSMCILVRGKTKNNHLQTAG